MCIRDSTWSEDPNNRDVAAELQRDVHTLKGGARMAGVDAIGDLPHVLEDLFEKVADGQLNASSDMNDLLFACHDRLAQMGEQVATQKPCPPATELVAKVEAILSGKPIPSAEPEDPAEEPEPVDEAPTADEQPASVTEAIAKASDDDLVGIFLDEGLEIHEAIGEQLTCIFVDHGLLRNGEAEQVIKTFRNRFNIELVHRDASDLFIGELEGKEDPEEKRKIIGELFIR